MADGKKYWCGRYSFDKDARNNVTNRSNCYTASYTAYHPVSTTQQQGRFGLGLEAQHEAVARYVA